jgi:hypothetical protein
VHVQRHRAASTSLLATGSLAHQQLAVITYCAHHSGQPAYLSALIKPYQLARSMRSSSQNLLFILPTKIDYEVELLAWLRHEPGTLWHLTQKMSNRLLLLSRV